MTISRSELTRQLLSLGVQSGGVLVVHTAFSQVRPIEGGPAGLIAALRDALGPGGTLVMPSMSDEDVVPFDLSSTACRGLGIVADMFFRVDDREVDHCCARFEQLDEWLGGRQHRGTVGHAAARLAQSRDIVEAALPRLREDEQVFLHAPGACDECDEARS